MVLEWKQFPAFTFNLNSLILSAWSYSRSKKENGVFIFSLLTSNDQIAQLSKAEIYAEVHYSVESLN